MAVYDKVRQLTVARLLDEAERASEIFDIFLAGPYIKPDLPPEDEVNVKSIASILRYYLYHKLSEWGHNIYLGEDYALREAGVSHYGTSNNAVLYERHYISKHIDAVIVLPSSPGSFCEIGDWVSDRDICSDMLIVVEGIHEGVANYINDGIVKFARSNHATVHYHAYSDQDGVLNLCAVFINEVAQRLRIERLYGRK
ncbi:hypothetical protein [Mesorhizobium sp. ES1-1]|uniref:hypothetical protein n=1 Tax=Mesorhizobium sp. ES1-1 TaxID=2876629 RepID=UPI001CCB46C9|nr:hypothetical protein [Mesorhizobium sp. ES1-1]MBZ9675143.1 hypothetical protein [Mesorhizobium sp. ES1-1]